MRSHDYIIYTDPGVDQALNIRMEKNSDDIALWKIISAYKRLINKILDGLPVYTRL